MNKPYKLSMSEAKQIRDHYRDGWELEELMEKYSVNKSTIMAILGNRTYHDDDYDPKELGLGYTSLKDRAVEILNLRGQGKTYAQIAEILSDKYPRVDRWGNEQRYNPNAPARAIRRKQNDDQRAVEKINQRHKQARNRVRK